MQLVHAVLCSPSRKIDGGVIKTSSVGPRDVIAMALAQFERGILTGYGPRGVAVGNEPCVIRLVAGMQLGALIREFTA